MDPPLPCTKVDQRGVDELVKFINGCDEQAEREEREKARAKAAKRQRQKQRKVGWNTVMCWCSLINSTQLNKIFMVTYPAMG